MANISPLGCTSYTKLLCSLLGSAARIHRIVTACRRSCLWGEIWAVVM